MGSPKDDNRPPSEPAANPVTGSASFSIPIATSLGRSGFGPQLTLAYDSAVDNGPFGYGWSLSLPSITRKTDKGLPRYDDAADGREPDAFILSGAEDLVPPLLDYGIDLVRQWMVTFRHLPPHATVVTHATSGHEVVTQRHNFKGATSSPAAVRRIRAVQR